MYIISNRNHIQPLFVFIFLRYFSTYDNLLLDTVMSEPALSKTKGLFPKF